MSCGAEDRKNGVRQRRTGTRAGIHGNMHKFEVLEQVHSVVVKLLSHSVRKADGELLIKRNVIK